MDSNSLMNPYRNAGRSGRNDRAQGEALAPQIALMATSVGETALAKANARAALAEAL
jgi:hypothetical protein